MIPPHNAQSSSNEAKINLAISPIYQHEIESARRAATIYIVPRTTLPRRRIGIASRQDRNVNSRKLSKLEEEVITERILESDSEGFSPTYDIVRDMANKLLGVQGGEPVGKH